MSRKQLLILTGVATVVINFVLMRIDQSLHDTGGPGIVPFEFVGSAGRASRYLDEWGDHGRDLAALSLWIDYAFMAAYGAFVALAGFATRDFARNRGMRRLAAAGRVAPYCAIGAALCDAVENANLLLVVGGHGGGVSPFLATAFASVKFLLIAIAIAYVIWGLFARLLARPRSPSPAR